MTSRWCDRVLDYVCEYAAASLPVQCNRSHVRSTPTSVVPALIPAFDRAVVANKHQCRSFSLRRRSSKQSCLLLSILPHYFALPSSTSHIASQNHPSITPSILQPIIRYQFSARRRKPGPGKLSQRPSSDPCMRQNTSSTSSAF